MVPDRQVDEEVLPYGVLMAVDSCYLWRRPRELTTAPVGGVVQVEPRRQRRFVVTQAYDEVLQLRT